MQPIIQRTITITVTETWTITWQDDRETMWQQAHAADSPTDLEPHERMSRPSNDEENDDYAFAPATDPLIRPRYDRKLT